MRDPEKKKAAQKKYDLKRTSKIVSLSFRASAEEEAEVRKVLGRFRAVIAAMRKTRSSSLKEELTRLVERLEAAGRKSAPAPDPEAAERAAFVDGSRF